jgi:hypothetical protein
MTDRPMTPKMRDLLATGVDKWDRSIDCGDMRIARGLITRGLVDVYTSEISYYHHRKGWWVTRTVISDLKINDKGFLALKAEGK